MINRNLKALSINQPWAWLITHGYKCVENRTWETLYRGDFLIHAGRKFDIDGYCFVLDTFPEIDLPMTEELTAQSGGIVGSATLLHVVHKSEGRLTTRDQPWFFGPYGFILDNAQPCDLIPCKGALKFFSPDYTSAYKTPIKGVLL